MSDELTEQDYADALKTIVKDADLLAYAVEQFEDGNAEALMDMISDQAITAREERLNDYAESFRDMLDDPLRALHIMGIRK